MKAAPSTNASISSPNHEFCNQEREDFRKTNKQKSNTALLLKPTLPRICQCTEGKFYPPHCCTKSTVKHHLKTSILLPAVTLIFTLLR